MDSNKHILFSVVHIVHLKVLIQGRVDSIQNIYNLIILSIKFQRDIDRTTAFIPNNYFKMVKI